MIVSKRVFFQRARIQHCYLNWYNVTTRRHRADDRLPGIRRPRIMTRTSANRMDRVARPVAPSAACGDPADDGDARIFPPARVDRPDDGADHPVATQARDFDRVRFGVLMAIVMEPGAIHPAGRARPLRHQDYRARSSAARCGLGCHAIVALMIFAVVLLCIFPGIATGLADTVMAR